MRKRGKIIVVLLLSFSALGITGCEDGRKDVPKSKDIEKHYDIKGPDGEPVESLLEDGDSNTEDSESKESGDDGSNQTENLKKQDKGKNINDSEDTQEVTSLNGWGGAYKDAETGDRLVIGAVGYEWSYCIFNSDGTVLHSESGCSLSVDHGGYIAGQSYTVVRNINGTLGITSGVGDVWGKFERVSGTANPDKKIEGTYSDGSTYLVVSEQIGDGGDESIPVGANIAKVQIEYNKGYHINAQLYTQEDGSLAIIDNASDALRGIITFKNNKAVITGSGFDGNYQLSE